MSILVCFVLGVFEVVFCCIFLTSHHLSVYSS
nr:MAG TPA: Herpesvirus UL41A [Caudoviricetes sp.]